MSTPTSGPPTLVAVKSLSPRSSVPFSFVTTLQDYRQLVYRSLGVPDAVTDVKHDRFPWTHRELVAALNLAKRAGVEPVA